MVNDNHASTREGRPASADRAEERAWIGFYDRVDQNPSLAIEIMAQLDADPDSKRRHLALYISCRESVRNHKARQARDRRIGELTQFLFGALVLLPLSATRSVTTRTVDLLVTCVAAIRTLAQPASPRAGRPTETDAGRRKVHRLTPTSSTPDRDGQAQMPPGTEGDQTGAPAVPLHH